MGLSVRPIGLTDRCQTPISVSDINGLKISKLCEHPEIRPQIEVMKTEVMKYQVLADSIKSFEERKDRVLTNSPVGGGIFTVDILW